MAIIAMLVVWAAFIIYRTVKGQRKKDGDKLETEKDTNPPGKTPNEEELDFCVESTGTYLFQFGQPIFMSSNKLCSRIVLLRIGVVSYP